MKVFFTRSVSHLAHASGQEIGTIAFDHFSDGELRVRIQDEVAGKEVWLVGATPTPAENIVEICLVLDALCKAGAKVNLLITYFGYARQDTMKKGESLSAAVLAHFFDQFSLNRFLVLHMHNPTFQHDVRFKSIINDAFFDELAKQADIIVAPDRGAMQLATSIAERCRKKTIFMHKVRPEVDQVELSFEGDVRGKSVLIVDDMITTGRTITQAAQLLKDAGAQKIIGAATHGIFSMHAFDLIEKSALEKLYVTNSIAQHYQHSRIETISLVPFINELVAI
ncbi:ribose-phosphate pyrophosphokinase [Candidatus Dependentiae bacterium]|nr:ribose-phosphate pyrophosphokinase [Candidatus Dependentiae bacterium]